jgi:hypothetical protein
LAAIEQNNSKVKQVTVQNSTTETILTELSKEILNNNQVGSILNNPTEFPKELIEELSLATALRYWNGQMTYRDGDCIMNNLYIYWMNISAIAKSYDFFCIAWECYLAFDAGEFYRDNDDRQIEPSEKYTRPLVESLLKKQKLIE